MLNQYNIQLRLNQYAQSYREIQDAKYWFESLATIDQLEVLRELSYLVLQAGANDKDVNEAIEYSRLKKTFTPCILLLKGNLKVQLSKILGLPPAEHTKSLLLLISLLSIADKRRRDTSCSGGCSHWWHKDLSVNNRE